MRVWTLLCFGAAALKPAASMKLSEGLGKGGPQTPNPKPSPDAEGLGFNEQQQQQQTLDLPDAAEQRVWEAAAEAQQFAAAAAAAAAAADVDAAERLAAAATAAAEEAEAAAAAAAAAANNEQETHQQTPAIFAPREFRFVDAAKGRTLSVFFHNAFEPFESVGCWELSSSPSVCVEHPRCVYKGPSRCLLSVPYLRLAGGPLCSRVDRGAPPPKPEEQELQTVAVDLLKELGIQPEPLMHALQQAGALDAESLCGLVKELAAEVLATERNEQPLNPDETLNPDGDKTLNPSEETVNPSDEETLNPSEGLVQDLLQSSLGFIAGGGAPLSGSPSPRLINPRPHNYSLTVDEGKPASATVLRASGNTAETAPIRIGINGFGRIGRLVFRIASSRPDMAVTHINSSMSPEYIAYMLKYDSVHGRFNGSVEVRDNKLFVNNNKIHLTAERNPSDINWRESRTDFVCESTGAFCTLKDANLHTDRPTGARHVVISAPAKDEETPTLVVGVNAESVYTPEMRVVSCASCTTNGLAPLVKVIDNHFGLEEGLMTTVHAVTGTQRVVDMNSNKDWRGGRAAGFNIIPSSTGAAKAVARCLPHMKGKLTGMAFRVPTLDVSVVDLTCKLKKETSYEEIKKAVREAAEGPMKGILGYTEEPVVSSDIIGSECSSVFDANAGIMLNPTFVKLVSWYDNEYAYSARLVDLIAIMAAKDGLVQEGAGLNRKPF